MYNTINQSKQFIQTQQLKFYHIIQNNTASLQLFKAKLYVTFNFITYRAGLILHRTT